MRIDTRRHDRRTFLKTAALGAAGCAMARGGFALGAPNPAASSAAVPLFDGKTLDGWIQILNSEISFSPSEILDLAAIAKKLSDKSDGVSQIITDRLDDSLKASLSAFAAIPTEADARELKSELAKNLTSLIANWPIYSSIPMVDHSLVLRAETQELISKEKDPKGAELARLNRMVLEDTYPGELAKSPHAGWEVKDGAIASTGAGRGVIYTAKDYGRFRLKFAVRHVSGKPDHQPCVLIFCTRPKEDEIPLDALGGIQFQPPSGGHWDYRAGKDTNGGAEFTTPAKGNFDPHEWSDVEILADASKGTARMAVTQPIGSKAVEILDFKDPAAGKSGPIALQMHNAGLFDQYKDITIEVDPKSDEL